jgi:hypothetical protein
VAGAGLRLGGLQGSFELLASLWSSVPFVVIDTTRPGIAVYQTCALHAYPFTRYEHILPEMSVLAKAAAPMCVCSCRVLGH